MKHYAIIIIFLLLILFSLDAETADTNVFAPFVSRIQVQQQGASLLISWKNSEDVRGNKKIYRYTEEITENNISKAALLDRVGNDVESYIDQPVEGAPVFYAVLIEDETGAVYNIFIPYRNKTITAVSLTIEKAASTFAEISNIRTQVSGNIVIVDFSNSEKKNDLILYRSTKQIAAITDLSDTEFSVILSGDITKYNDTVIAGIEYFYTVLDADLARSGKAEIKPGANTTTASVSVAIAESAADTSEFVSRTFPLPAPHILYGVESGNTLLPPTPFLLPPKSSLSKTNEESINALASRLQFAETKPVTEILPIDNSENLDGESKELKSIISEMLIKSRYSDAQKALNVFLQKDHEDAVAARARFYRGQAFYHMAQYKEALIDFILAEDSYYLESHRWIDACFNKINTESE